MMKKGIVLVITHYWFQHTTKETRLKLITETSFENKLIKTKEIVHLHPKPFLLKNKNVIVGFNVAVTIVGRKSVFWRVETKQILAFPSHRCQSSLKSKNSI